MVSPVKKKTPKKTTGTNQNDQKKIVLKKIQKKQMTQ
jgi:hypothetical protein